jgi:hypothetical protein
LNNFSDGGVHFKSDMATGPEGPVIRRIQR